jgi:hypothetical protein
MALDLAAGLEEQLLAVWTAIPVCAKQDSDSSVWHEIARLQYGLQLLCVQSKAKTFKHGME